MTGAERMLAVAWLINDAITVMVFAFVVAMAYNVRNQSRCSGCGGKSAGFIHEPECPGLKEKK